VPRRKKDSAPVERGETRARILEGAFAVVAERGLAALTLREVAETARVALGLVNYHFASKQALLLELIAASRARFLGELGSRVTPAPTAHLLRQLLELAGALPAFMPGWFRLNADLDSLALRDPSMLAAAALNKQRGAADVTQYFEAVAETAGSALPRHDLGALVDVIYAAFDGLAIRSMIDDQLDLSRAHKEIEQLILLRIAPGTAPHPEAWNHHVLDDAEPAPFGVPSAHRTKARSARSRASKGRK